MPSGLTGKLVQKCMDAISEFLTGKYEVDQGSYGIKSLTVQQACEAGDNFLGQILSVKFSVNVFPPAAASSGSVIESKKRGVEVEDFELILKSQSLDDGASDSQKMFWGALFFKERMIYQEVMARLEQLGQLPLAPKLHHCYNEGEDYSSLLMDNLISLGYYIPDFRTLNLDECISVHENLARLHALAVVWESQEGVPLVEKYEVCGAEMMFGPGMDVAFKPMVQNSMKGVLKAAEKFRPDLVAALTEFNDTKTVWARACEAVLPGQTSFSTVCHGDPRLKNIFLSQEPVNSLESHPTCRLVRGSSKLACRFIDFQLTRYASPVTDLLYFLYTATDRRFREAHLATLLSSYFDQFFATLRTFPNVPLPPPVRSWTREKLAEEFEGLKSYAVVVALFFIPIIYMRPADMMDVSLADMPPAEKENFMLHNRAEVVYSTLNRNDIMRERIFEALEELLLPRMN